MLSKPLSHFLVGPSPLEWMGIEPVVLGPGGVDLVDQGLAAGPGRPLQVVEAEGAVEQFRLIEPGGMDRGESRPPPGMGLEVSGSGGCGMAGVAVLDQEGSFQLRMIASKLLQSLDVVRGILVLRATSLHLSRRDAQEQQHVDGAVADVLELLLLDGAGNGAPNRVALQGLEIGHLIHANDQKSTFHQSVGVGVTPEDLLGSAFEVGIRPGCLPVAGAVWLQIDLMQDAPHGPGAQARNNAVGHRLIGKIAGFNGATNVGKYDPAVAPTNNCAAGSVCTSIFDTRWANSIAYISPSFSGFSVVGAYVADENKTSETTAAAKDAARTTGYDVGAKYANGPWMAAVTYNWYQVGDYLGTTADNVRVGGSYTGANWSVRLMWEETGYDAKNVSGANTKQQKWGIGGTYLLGKANLPAQYYQAMDMDATYIGGKAINGDNTGAQLAMVGVEYSLSKRTMLKGVYSWLSNDSQAVFDYGVGAVGTSGVGSTLQGVQMGVRHAF